MFEAGIFAGLLLLSALGFLLGSRRLDLFQVAIFANGVYGLPLLVGADAFGDPLHPRCFETHIGLHVLLLGCQVLRARRSAAPEIRWSRSQGLSSLALIVCAAIFVLVLLVYGPRVLFVHKLESGIHPVVYILWRLSASSAFVLCVLEGRLRALWLPAGVLFATFLAGDRTAIALSAIAACLALLSGRRIRRRRMIQVSAGVVGLGLLLLFGKILQAQWQTSGRFDLSDAAVTIGGDTGRALRTTEPFVVMGVESRLFASGLSAPPRLLADTVLQCFPLPGLLGADSAAFNDWFQPRLFPEYRERSLAYSFWGEAHVHGGRPMQLFFALLFVGGLAFFERLRRSRSEVWQLFALLGGAYWAFYVHRNSLASILTYVRHVALFAFLLALALATLRWLAARRWEDEGRVLAKSR